MLIYFWIALGSGLGGMARHALAGLTERAFGETFPWGTLIVNVSGCLVIGFIATLTEPGGRILVSHTGRQFLMAGFLGGFTTFSSFSLQTLSLARDGDWLPAAANALGSLVLCLAAVVAGHLLAEHLVINVIQSNHNS